MIPESLLLPLANHLWQSTVFAGVAGLLTLALRKNRARVRHWLWVVASCKFLIPFSALISLGGHIGGRTAPIVTASNFPIALDQVSQPFAAPVMSFPVLATVPRPTNLLPAVLWTVWACGFIGIAGSWWIRWRRIRSAVRAGSPVQLDIPIRAISSPTLLEPGVFGVFRPVLLLPEGISERLMPAQWKAVVAHELCHVRHRDNLIATIQMFVETVFWFHPLVWWIGKRMIEERERACDEEVLRLGNEPRAYAQGMLTVCEFYLNSRVACVAGVSGANLRKRIEEIMSNRIVDGLDGRKKLLLGLAGALAVAVPIAFGVLSAPSARAQSTVLWSEQRPMFEVASVKPTTQRHGLRLDGGTYNDATDLLSFIVMAYGLNSCVTKVGVGVNCPLISGTLPAWGNSPFPATSNLFEIQAKLPDNPRIATGYTVEQVRQGKAVQLSLMLQSLLADQFHLKVHRETKELPVYALTVGRNGPKLKQTNAPELINALDGTSIEHHGINAFEPVLSPDGNRTGKRRITFQGSSMQQVADSLAGYLDRPVLDRTGLKEDYDFKVEYEVDPDATNRSGGALTALFSGLTCSGLSAALQDAGLKCESTKGPVEVLVIDHVERPSEN